MLTELLTQIDTLDEAITRVSNEIATLMQEVEPAEQDQTEKQKDLCEQEQDPSLSAPLLTWAHAVVLLCTIPGISRRAAEGILAEIGLDMARFPSDGHLASSAGMCPGNHESVGKTRKGNTWLRKLLVEAAHAAAHTKNTYLSAQYRRVASRRGKKKAMIAVGHSIFVIIYHILSDQTA